MSEKKTNSRRVFIKKCGVTGITAVPLFLNPFVPIAAANPAAKEELGSSRVNYVDDGLMISPPDYLRKLEEINAEKSIERDFYGQGGATQLLEEKFAEITGKEKAIYLPSGTMANQLAIKLLNGINTKVIVPENSHIYRDEADAAQSVHSLRLIPTGKDKPFFDLEDVKASIDYLNQSEVFESGLGTIAIESPVRRADGAVVPFETLREITEFAIENGYKMHLDGARLHLASFYTGVSIVEYASLFDTVYISLYKYLHANGGAVLCGDEDLINRVSHQIKILGGTVYQNWTNTSVALHSLENIEARWKQVLAVGGELIGKLNELPKVNVKTIENGSNIYRLKFADSVNVKEVATHLYKEEDMMIRRPNEAGEINFYLNESVLRRDINAQLDSWKRALKL